MRKASNYVEGTIISDHQHLTNEELQHQLELYRKAKNLPQFTKEEEEEEIVKYIAEAEELDSIQDREKLKIYEQWIDKNTLNIPLWPNGVFPGKLNLLVAGTGVGKSTFLQNVSHHLSQKGKVLYLSAEEDKGTIAVKLWKTGEALVNTWSIEEERSIIIRELTPSNKDGLIKQLQNINKQKYDFIVFDYIKSNLLTGDLSAHEAISQIVDAFYQTMVRPNLKTVCFAAIQTNSVGNAATVQQVAANYIPFVEGRAYAPRHAASVLFLLKDDLNVQALVCKSREMERVNLNKVYKYSFGGLENPILKYLGTADLQGEIPPNKMKKMI